MTKETLEEAAKNYNLNTINAFGDYESFIAGAKWQQEKSYSEEEVKIKLYECLGHFAQKHNIIINGNEIDQWFKQFKNK